METTLDWSIWLPAWIVSIVVYAGISLASSGTVSVIDITGVAFGFGMGLVAVELYRRRSGNDD